MSFIRWSANNWLKILFFIGAVLLLKALMEHSAQNIQKLYEFPEEVSRGERSICYLANYKECVEGDWGALLRSSKPLYDQSEIERRFGEDYTDLMNLLCVHRSDVLNSSQIRIIENFEDEFNLVLCRLRDPEVVDRGRFLEVMERIQYH